MTNEKVLTNEEKALVALKRVRENGVRGLATYEAFCDEVDTLELVGEVDYDDLLDGALMDAGLLK